VELLTREWDLMELPGGQILTVVGTYGGRRARGRLTYVPDDDGGLEIFGRRYRKTSFEIWGHVPYAKQMLALPGESHYVVRAVDIARHYPAVPLEPTRPELADVVAALGAADVPVAVGGSRALGASRAESDYDLVVYGKDNIERAAKVITGLPGYSRDVHFGMDFVRAKYRHFTRLSADDLAVLVGDRWRHFQHRGLPMSVDGADPNRQANRWAAVAVFAKEPGHVRGFVVDGAQCYLSPKILDVRTDTGTVRVFTWLNLYAGALRTGDEVEAFGHWVVMNQEKFLLVAGSDHAIRVLSRTSTNPV
jgi:predicted nucleotidyltransferase